MKKTLLLLVCAISALTASAQRAESSSSSFFSTERAEQPVTFGIRGGVNFAKQTASSDGYSFSAKSNVGFNAGVSVDIPMLESLYLQTGLYYTVKGYEFDDEGDTLEANPSYLEVPILASYRYNFSDRTQLQINVGPYVACGIAGKYKFDGEEVDYFDGDNRRFDAGLAFGAGMTFGHIYVGLNYDLGLTNVEKDSDGSLKNRCLSINVGYNF